MPIVECQVCHYKDFQETDVATLNPCNHLICSWCLIEKLSVCNSKVHGFKCPCCNVKLASTSYKKPCYVDKLLKVNGKKNRKKQRVTGLEEKTLAFAQDNGGQTVITIHNDTDRLRRRMAAYYKEYKSRPEIELFHALGGKQGTIATHQCRLSFNQRTSKIEVEELAYLERQDVEKKKHSISFSDEDTKSLCEIFKNFHWFFKLTSMQYFDNKEEALPMREIVPFMHADTRPFIPAFYSLATGKGYDEWQAIDHWGDATIRHAIAIPCLAADILARLSYVRIAGPSIRFLTFALDHYRGGVQKKVFCSLFRLVESASTTQYKRAREFMQAPEVCVKLQPRDLLLVMSDNIQWKIKFGRKAGGYEHKFAVAFFMKTEEELIKDGIYEKKLSRKQIAWENLIKPDVLEADPIVKADPIGKYVGLTPAKVNMLCQLILTHIEATLTTRLFHTFEKKDLESLVKSKQWNFENAPEGSKYHNIRFPLLHRILQPEDLDSLGELWVPPEETTNVTIWDVNNIKASYLISMPYGSTEAIVELMELLKRLGDSQMNEWKELDENVTAGKERPISDLFRGFAGDGAPIAQMNRLKDVDENGRWKCNIAICGVFHFFMAAFKRANSSHEDLIRFLLHLVQAPEENKEVTKTATDKNVDWFLSFNDPTEPEKKMGKALLAIYDYAIREMKRSGKATSATPIDVWKFMREAAVNKPLALHLLNLVIFWELALMVRRCERNNDADGFFDTLPLFLPVFASTHGTEYMKICCDLIKYWATCSELEKVLIRKYGFTLETGTGTRVGLDFCFEKYVNLIRGTTGKIYSRGHGPLAEASALSAIDKSRTQDFKKQIKPNIQRATRSDPKNRFQSADGRDYMLVMIQLEKSRVFHDDKEAAINDNTFWSPRDTKSVLDHRLLSLLTLGEERARQYFSHYYVNQQSPKPDLTPIPSDVVKSDKRKQQLVTLFTGTAISTLEKAATRETLVQQILMVREHWPSDNAKKPKPTTKLPTAKPALLELLVKERKELFALNGKIKGIFEKKALEDYKEGTTAESRKKQLEHLMLSFKGCDSMDSERAKKTFDI